MDLLALLRRAAELAGVTVTLQRPGLAPVTVGRSAAQGASCSAQTPGGGTITVQQTVDPGCSAQLEAVLEHVMGLVIAHDDSEAEAAALTEELLERYEEITLLYEISRELVAVFDESEACATVLRRAATLLPIGYGQVLLVDAEARLTGHGANVGVASPDQERLAQEIAAETVTGGFPVLVDRGQLWRDRPVDVPVLAVPLSTGSTDTDGAPLGAMILLGRQRSRFTAGEVSLASTVAVQLATVVANGRLVSFLREKERIEREVEIAASVQRQLLPVRSPPLPGLTMRALCVPAASVGGDYFDFVPDEHGAATLVADVSGHGIGPGLMMAMTRTALRRELQDNTPLPEALVAVNGLMWDDMMATGLFITLFCVRYNSRTSVLSYVNAGHHPALLRRADGSVNVLDSDGYPFGLIPDPVYEQRSVTLAEGDVVLLYTDGIVEERAPTGEMFGTGRLMDTVAQAEAAVIPAVVDAVATFRGEAPQQDDVTMVELRRDRTEGE